MSRLSEIESRLMEIRGLVDAEDADIDALTAETDSLMEERTKLQEAEQKRQAMLRQIAAGQIGTEIETQEDTTMEERTFTLDSKEYRNAWLNHLRGVELSEVEQRAFATAGSAIATETANDIMTVIKENAPILGKMTVVRTGAITKYYVEGTNNDAIDHTENSAITAAADTLSPITLTPAEIVKMIQISEAVKAMSVDAFEAWIAKNIGEAIAAKINAKITAAITTAATSRGTAVSAATVQALLGGVKGGNVTVICNRNVLFTKLLPLQDNSKNNLVSFAGGSATIYGCPVLVDDSVAGTTILAGDLTKAVAALAEDINIRNQYDINTNSYKYLGVALFDVEVGVSSAFGKIVVAG